MGEFDELRPSKGQRMGWWILIGISLLLALNGVALYFISASPVTFEQDTGVAYQEVQAVFPSVAEQLVREGQISSLELAAVGLMAAVAAWTGLQKASRWAWVITGLLLAMLLMIGIRLMVFDIRVGIGVFYIVLASIALAGQILSGRNLTA